MFWRKSARQPKAEPPVTEAPADGTPPEPSRRPLGVVGKDTDPRIESMAAEWGWQDPPASIRSMAGKVVHYSGLTVDQIAVEEGLLGRERADQLLAQKPSAARVLDYLVSQDSAIAQKKELLQAYTHGLPYFTDFDVPGVRLHPELATPELLSACENHEALLLLVDNRKAMLVFAERENGFRRFSQMAGHERESNALYQRFGDKLAFGLGRAENIAQSLALSRGNDGDDVPRQQTIVDADLREMGEALRLLADIHEVALSHDITDIHLDIDSDYRVTVKFRISKDLEPASIRLTVPQYFEIKQFLLVQSGAAIKFERMRQPLDGMYAYDGKTKKVTVRCSFIGLGHSSTPMQDLVSIRLRLIPVSRGHVRLEDLGVDPLVLSNVRLAMRPNAGLVLSVGPTGSGKSSLLAGMICEHERLHGPARSRTSLEDPVERFLPGVVHIQIPYHLRHESGVFAKFLRAMLRHDPDMIMVGEIRDEATAEAATNAATTGHLVISTIHAENTVEAVERLSNLIPPEKQDLRAAMIRSLGLLIGQRLVKRLCPQCSSWTSPSPDDHEFLAYVNKTRDLSLTMPDRIKQANPSGCEHEKCRKGYCGVKPVNEVLPVTRTVKRAFLTSSGADIAELDSECTLLMQDAIMAAIRAGEVPFSALEI